MAKHEQPEEMKCPQWMMTFGDFISLLVTFFVMLIAFSTFEEEKLAAMIGSLKGALGVVAQPGTERPAQPLKHFEQVTGLVQEPRWLSIEQLSVVMPGMQMAMKRFGTATPGSERYVTVAMLDEGMAILISVKPLFAPGTSILLPGNERLLEEIGSFVEVLANEVRIISVVHESVAVLSGTAITAWGLAIERAMAFQEGLLRECDLPRERFGIGARVQESVPGSKDAQEAGVRPLFMRAGPRLQIPGDNPVFAAERMEIIIMGKRSFSEMPAEEVIVRDKWK